MQKDTDSSFEAGEKEEIRGGQQSTEGIILLRLLHFPLENQ